MWTGANPFAMQLVTEAGGFATNCDYFPVHITRLPSVNNQPFGIQDLLDYFRKNINSFVNTSIATFEPYNDPNLVNDHVLWNSPNPVSALLHLNMKNDGTVMVSDYKSDPVESYFTVSTVKSWMDGNHPVSGNRQWGIKEDPVNGGYTFYTSAVDRITTTYFDYMNAIAELLPGVNSGFDDADMLWRSLQQKMVEFINSHGGEAKLYPVTPDITFRPPWILVERYLKKGITLEQLKQALGCP